MLKRIDQQIARLEQSSREILAFLGGESESKAAARGSGQASRVLHDLFGSRLRAKTLKELRVAAIMDRFTLECFRPECVLTELTPESWREEMAAADPELLFVESAWEGKERRWYQMIDRCAPALRELTDYCHDQGIPVVFWNKEDPIYTDTFMAAARCADAVFTTDLDCVEKYKAELGHDNVYHLHFAAQPLLHNPEETRQRKDRFCFAGAYYHRYQERCRVFDAFADCFLRTRGLDIYDRNYLNARPEHKFPERYDPYILGKLDPSEIEVAYKGYTFGVNMNSVSQSQTMFARRAFELMASNTVVVGNYSRGLKNYFGDLTVCTDDAKTLEAALAKYCGDRAATDKLRLAALRKVLSEHLCEDRLDYVAYTVFGSHLKRSLPPILVFARTESPAEASRVTAMFRTQSYENRKLLLVGCGPEKTEDADVTVLTPEAFAAGPVPAEAGSWLACFDPDDWYGPNYLKDLALTLRYGSYAAVGKAEYLRSGEGGSLREGDGKAYRPADRLPLRRSIVRADVLAGIPGSALSGDYPLSGEGIFSADALNYCQDWGEDDCPEAADLPIADAGIPLREIEAAAEAITPPLPDPGTVDLGASRIAATPLRRGVPLTLEQKDGKAVLTSRLPENTHEYLYLADAGETAALSEDGKLSALFLGSGDLDLVCGLAFYDKSGNRLEPRFVRLGRRETVEVPEGAVTLRPLLRPKGPGSAALERIVLSPPGSEREGGGCFLSRSHVLILTNHYPSAEDLYRNMFVHRRVAAYKEKGSPVDVLQTIPRSKGGYREFEGVNVTEGRGDRLAAILSCGRIDTVCVHFLDRDMWEVLKNYTDSIRLIIWSHGADIQPWWRREFNYHTEAELTVAKEESRQRMDLWNEVLDAAERSGGRISLVFVSEYARSLVEEDYHRSLAGFSRIIPNFIDTELFSYRPKAPEERFRVISIRPFASDIYANDLSVKAICELADKPWFREMHFTVIGRGPLFESTVRPLRRFDNVELRETFLRQAEIAELYHRNGVVLIPTRGDTQGVSRDEAMSCGLVPVTNGVAAIPEFVDESCGILAPAEDFRALAGGIARLHDDPALFLRMSEAAAARVRRQTAEEFTIPLEMSMIFPAGESSAGGT